MWILHAFEMCLPKLYPFAGILKCLFCILTGYLLREIKKADISLPEGDVNPVAPLPKHVIAIMVC